MIEVGRWLWRWLPFAVGVCLFSIVCLDASVAYYVQAAPRHGLLAEPWWRFCSELGNSTWWLLLGASAMGLGIVWLGRAHPCYHFGRCVLISVLSSGLVLNLLKILFARARPRLLFREGLYGFEGWNIGSDVGSFPSGHTTTIVTLALLASWAWPKSTPLWVVIAILVAVSRVVLGSHYVADTLAGLYVGSGVALVLRTLHHRKFRV
jgi:membrane-associated phospholipid phosphatase